MYENNLIKICNKIATENNHNKNNFLENNNKGYKLKYIMENISIDRS